MTPTIKQCVSLVARVRGIKLVVLYEKSRRRAIVWPRQDAMLLAREFGYSLPEIAEFFDMDHTTVIHGTRAAAKRRAEVLKSVSRRA